MDTMEYSQIAVLIVDDNENNLQIAAKVVSAAGFLVMLAPDGQSALEMMAEEVPDAVLLDIMMPHMDGLEVCRRMKMIPGCEEIPVIFLTALGEEDRIEEGLSIGGVDYVTKPFNERVLLARLRSHIDRGIYQKITREYNKVLREKNHELQLIQAQLLVANQDLEEQIQKNIEIFATLNDKIRNPLSVIATMLDMDDHEYAPAISDQLTRIDKVVDELDRGFLESEKVKAYLDKHHA